MNQETKSPGGKAELRRQQILDAAAECFRKSGFHAASMAEIAKSFGMSAGHIYNYFESKEAIIAAMVKRDMDQALERIARIQGEKDILKAMLGTVDEGVQRRIDRRELDMEILAEAARNPKVAATVQCTDAVIREKVSNLIEGILLAGSTPEPTPDATADTPGNAIAGNTEKQSLAGKDKLAAKSTILMALFDGLQIRAIRDPNMDADEIARLLKAIIPQLLKS
ncbi:MAG TPA: TetR/AcrR family transcriptional regulator [Limnobacter sp.]|nr:TetR/AcrR family transcriptional regulator [Limnobacter sp.]